MKSRQMCMDGTPDTIIGNNSVGYPYVCKSKRLSLVCECETNIISSIKCVLGTRNTPENVLV